jgi:CHAT domain-containing protein
MGDYRQSIRYFSKALALAHNNTGDTAYFVLNYTSNIASAYRKLQDYPQALMLYQSLLPYHINTSELLHNIGATYLNAGNYRAALYYLKQVTYHNQVRNNDLARVYLGLKKYDSAFYFLEAALRLYQRQANTRKNYDYAITLKYLGDWYAAQQKSITALAYYQRAIIQADPDFNDTSITRNPLTFEGLHQYIFLFETLIAKARAFATMPTGNSKNWCILQSYTTYQAAINLVQHIERVYTTDESRLFLKKQTDVGYKEMTELGLQLYELSKNKSYLEQVFTNIEQYKASVLQTDLHELELTGLKGVPQELLLQEKKLKTTITSLHIQLSHIQDPVQATSLEEKIRDHELQLQQVQQRLDTNARYHQLKFLNKKIDIDAMARQLQQQDGALLSYFYTNTRLICFYICNGQFGYMATPKTKELIASIMQLRQELEAGNGSNRAAVRNLSLYLFHQLVSPVLNRLQHLSRLVIVPYNEIGYISFDMLIDPDNDAYLVKKFATSYLYSASFFSGNQTASQAYQVLAVAPFTTPVPGNIFPVLKASRKEISGLPGYQLFDSAATKQHFISSITDYPVVHLATHALAKDEAPMSSFIAFYPFNQADTGYYLYEREIYNLDLSKVKLVILSACETGKGQLVSSEGIMSLSRAFSYAGCKSVIASMWKADDETTASIASRLHHYLRKGMPIDKALQQARIDFLNNEEVDAHYTNPAYWSQLVLIGDFHPVATASYRYLYYSAAATLLSLLIMLIQKSRTRKPYAALKRRFFK